MLGLIEPQSSGLAGGAILLHYDAASGRVDSCLGRERAPGNAGPAMFDRAKGQPLTRAEAMLSGRATGTPGVLPALELAHDAHGVLPWATLFDTTIARAARLCGRRLQQHIDGRFPQAAAADVRALFADAHGRPLRAGGWLRNPDYAQSLQRIALQGAAAAWTACRCGRGATGDRYNGEVSAFGPELAERLSALGVRITSGRGRTRACMAWNCVTARSAAPPICAAKASPPLGTRRRRRQQP